MPRFLLLASLLAAPSLDRAIDLHTAGRLREALAEYHAVAAAEQKADPATAATALDNACVIRMDLGEYRAALPDCREALRLERTLGDPETLGRALNNLALDLQALGETSEAERLFREALALNRRTGNAESETVNLSNLGTLALSAGRYTEALALQAQAAALAERHGSEPWAGEQVQIARINQGVILEKVGAHREALDVYRKVLTGELDPARRAALLVNSGVIYRNLGDPVRAMESFREAIGIYGETEDAAALSNAWLNLGLASHLNLELPEEAERAYREALRLAEESGDRTEEIQDLFYLGRLLLERGRLDEAGGVFQRCLKAAEASGSPEGVWSAREGLGRIARARGDLTGALGHFERALLEIEKVRSGLARGTRRAGYFGDKRAVYAATVDVLAELGQGERALAVVQRAKSRDLLDALGEAGREAAPLDAPALARKVREGTVFEYFLGESNLYLWVIRPGAVRFHDLGPGRPVIEAALAVHRALARGEQPPANLLAALSRVLLRPLPKSKAPLRIAPDGALRYLPFEILGDPPLIERSAVVYLPSASALGRSGGEAADGFLGIGDPRLDGHGLSPRELLIERFGLAPLPGAARELAAVGKLLGGPERIFTGPKATEEAFRQAVGGARVVHLATHTVIDERPGRGAAILLTASGQDDGLLTPGEIARVRGRSDLTVLAACRTALGPGEDGQALASLTGSFLAAGSRGVVATLWDVDDAATAAFMQQFYWELGRGRTPAEALRAAKRRMRADPRWNRPDLWAGYVLIGEAPPVVSRRSGWIWSGLALLAAAAAVWLSARRGGRSRSSGSLSGPSSSAARFRPDRG